LSTFVDLIMERPGGFRGSGHRGELPSWQFPMDIHRQRVGEEFQRNADLPG
jgi:hypothetical protein